MALIDDIRRIAQQKSSYNPGLANRQAPVTARARPAQRAAIPNIKFPVPQAPVARPVRVPQGAQGGGQLASYLQSRGIDLSQIPNSGVAPEPEGPGLASRLFSGIIDVVDTPRAAAVATLGELRDLPGARALPYGLGSVGSVDDPDGSFDLKDLLKNTRDNVRFAEEFDVSGAPDIPLPFTDKSIPMGGAAGFAGDLAVDPLTYLTAGTVGAAAKGSGSALKSGGREGLNAIDIALRGGSRRELAQTVATEAAKRNLADDIVDPLIREAGMRGRGAFTRQGLQRAGVSDDVLKQLGLQSDFGYRVGLGGSKGITIKGSRVLAETSENLKGSMKKAFGDTKGGKLFRNMFVGSSDDALGAAERRFMHSVMTGATDSAQAARGLAVIRAAKTEGYGWMDDKVTAIQRDFGKEMKRLSNNDAADLTHAIESGNLEAFTQLSGKVRQWFDETGQELRDINVEFGNIDNYVNHMMTPRARRAVINGEARVGEQGLDAALKFQKTRELRQGMEFLGETIPVVGEGGYATIKQLNDIAQRVVGYKFYEDDIRSLMTAYLEQATKARMQQQTKNLAGGGVISKGLAGTPDIEFSGFDSLNVNDAVQVGGVQEALEEATRQGADDIAAAAKLRKQGITEATREVGRAKKATLKQMSEVEKTIADINIQIETFEQKLATATATLRAKQGAVQFWQDQLDAKLPGAKKSAAATKAAATKKIKKLQDEIADLETSRASLIDQIGKANTKKEAQKLGEKLEVLKQDAATKADIEGRLTAERVAMDDPNLPIKGTEEQVVQLQKATEQAEQVRQKFLTDGSVTFDAAAAWVYQLTDLDTLGARLANQVDKLDAALEVKKGLGQAAADDLRGRSEIVLNVLRDTGMDSTKRSLVKTEVQALVADLNSGRELIRVRDAHKGILKSLEDPKFQEYMTRVLEDGFVRINDELAIPQWYDDAFKHIPKSMEDWGRVRTFFQKYDQAMNWWKGLATTSPGFVFRNMYGGFFNMYLDDVNPVNVFRFNGFLRNYQKSGLEGATKWALKRGFSDEEIRDAQLALRAAGASGWGLNPQEVTHELVGAGKSWNPFDVNFAPTKSIREASTGVEALMRGSHAYDVIRRGGDWQAAIAHVEKFHFNYRDISQFDQAAKRVIPFWTFYSRNMVLQSEMWARFPQKLNRSYFNLKENLELQSDPDAVVPGYYDELGAIRLPIGERDGGTWYLTPDLPSLRFRSDFAQLTVSNGEGFDPVRMVSDFGPALKVPVELAQNRELFTDIPYKNRLYDYDSQGQPIPRKANDLFQGEIPGTDISIPVLDQLIPRAADAAFGDNAEFVNGELLMQDNLESAIEDFVPLVGRVERLLPNSDKYKERVKQSRIGFAGLPVRQNTEQAVQGELYSRGRQASDAQRKAAIEALLKEITK